MENCLKCPIYEWPNNEKTMCIEKQTEFLSYEGDSLTLVFIVLSVVSLLLVTVIIGIFISFRDTPVVKANNRNLSFILLFSIKLSFLSVFLFLGRPSDITCILRQTSFGISFSIAMSSVLAKTIMVCIAFKASKPNSPWRKWLGVKITYFIVIICSFIQFLISGIWLIISPPFMELNILSEPGKIIIQCNEGSVIAFYIVLSYMGLLASVSFIVAFLARTLPDSFNEAKYITFSMLLFCSVWITMIPAYLSTKGKYMVAVEIFAIISSSCGLLFCIFLTKYSVLYTTMNKIHSLPTAPTLLMGDFNNIPDGAMDSMPPASLHDYNFSRSIALLSICRCYLDLVIWTILLVVTVVQECPSSCSLPVELGMLSLKLVRKREDGVSIVCIEKSGNEQSWW
ncbi:vomeronasal type-2 receptor 26-like [Xenopus laevis]|uniref:Vomeronasal type-2 receptor 26-like n=1 Tax=Xenopus laevis TaxID=8355 RepID=A0A8J1MC81_XENLA|nr:vomeronasal type-2 receptor 26-like [Xenopus laevis]